MQHCHWLGYMLDDVGKVYEIEARLWEGCGLQIADEHIYSEGLLRNCCRSRAEFDSRHAPAILLEVAEIRAIAAADIQRLSARNKSREACPQAVESTVREQRHGDGLHSFFPTAKSDRITQMCQYRTPNTVAQSA